MRDTLTDLTADLATAHPVLACLRLDAKGWSTFLATLATSSRTDIDVVCAMLRPDLASRVRAFVAGTVSGEVQPGTSCGVESSPAVIDSCVREHASAQGMAVWGGDDAVLDVDVIAHSNTVRPAESAREVSL